MITRTGKFSYAAMAAVILIASGCNSDSTSPFASIAGTYVLQSANGQLPLRFTHTDATGTSTIDIVSGTLSIGTNRAFEEVLQYHVTSPTGAVTDPPVITNGTFTVDGSTITFTFHPSGGQAYVWTGTIGDSEITYTDTAFADVSGGLTAVYTK